MLFYALPHRNGITTIRQVIAKSLSREAGLAIYFWSTLGIPIDKLNLPRIQTDKTTTESHQIHHPRILLFLNDTISGGLLFYTGDHERAKPLLPPRFRLSPSLSSLSEEPFKRFMTHYMMRANT